MTRGKYPPSPPHNLVWGSLLDFVREPLEFLMRTRAQVGDVAWVRVPGVRAYTFSHPDDIEVVLRTNAQNFIKDQEYQRLKLLLGNGLLTSEDAYWRRQRKLAQPAFQPKHIQSYQQVMVDFTERAAARWKPGEVRDIHDDMMYLTLEIVGKTLFNSDVTDQAAEVGECLEVAMTHFSQALSRFLIPEWLPVPRNRRFKNAIKRLDNIVYRLIRERRESGDDPGDLLSRLLNARDEDGNAMTDQQLRDELITLFLAGHETTALSLSYTLYLLAQNPDVEEKLAAELATVLGGRPPTGADLPQLKYTDWVVRESMRVFPPAWGVGREAVNDCEVGGYLVPKGTQVLISQWVVHRDPRYFPEPERFFPDRWANDFAKTLPRCAYFPFGEGPRICIGNHFAMMEAILMLATLVQRYHMELAPGAPLELMPSITLRPKHGIKMKLHPRVAPALAASEHAAPALA